MRSCALKLDPGTPNPTNESTEMQSSGTTLGEIIFSPPSCPDTDSPMLESSWGTSRMVGSSFGAAHTHLSCVVVLHFYPEVVAGLQMDAVFTWLLPSFYQPTGS